ncbi:MAG: hypothetical protein K2X61_15090 [Caulobacteraceae bacterium]|nr:hypothetical protein [Caulobacteraceae bacterium]
MTASAPSVSFVPRNRLAKILTSLDRKAFAEHVRNAEQELNRLAPILGESIEGDVQALIRLCRQDEADIFGQSYEIGWLALKIVESARLAKRHELADAAEGVWEMIDALTKKGVWHTEALRVHVEALLALLALSSDPGTDAAQRQVIARELLKMRTAVGASDL